MTYNVFGGTLNLTQSGGFTTFPGGASAPPYLPSPLPKPAYTHALLYIMHTLCTGTDQVPEVSELESSSRSEAGSGLVEQVESNGRR